MADSDGTAEACKNGCSFSRCDDAKLNSKFGFEDAQSYEKSLGKLIHQVNLGVMSNN